jgi:LPXTG-site transpeptidase (sortase) family protein
MFRTALHQDQRSRARLRLFAGVQFPVFVLCLLLLVNGDSRSDMASGESPATGAGFAGQVTILEFDTATPKQPTASILLPDQVAPTPVPQATVQVDPAPVRQQAGQSAPTPVPQEAVSVEAEPSATDVPASVATVYAPMTRLRIQSVGIDSSIEVKTIGPDGVMQAPGGPDIVTWYDFSSQSIDDGNAVFAGHLDYAGYGPAVFWRLGDVQPGDVIEVHHADGVVVRYAVTSVQPFSASDDASSVVASHGRPTITLITCDGDFDPAGRAYADRLVVTGDRID